VPVEVTLQTVAYFDYPLDGPVWIEESEDHPYGFPSDRHGAKIGLHRRGRPVDPDDPERAPDPERIEVLREVARTRFGRGGARLSFAQGCLYTNSATDDFLLGRLGENGFYASACSGHGFKFGPWIGRLLADFVDGKDAPENHPRFLYPLPLAAP
jgi:sarcosine oxidase